MNETVLTFIGILLVISVILALTWIILKEIQTDIKIIKEAQAMEDPEPRLKYPNPKGPICQSAIDIRLPGEMKVYDDLYCHSV